jgi:hypothetical protein
MSCVREMTLELMQKWTPKDGFSALYVKMKRSPMFFNFQLLLKLQLFFSFSFSFSFRAMLIHIRSLWLRLIKTFLHS